MPWFKVDDNLAFHQKALRAGNAAMGLWVRAGSWCAQQLSDGFVPRDMARTLGSAAEAKKLVEARLWLEVEGGYEFWQWSEEGRQPTRAEVEDRRKATRERQRRAREKAQGVTALVTPTVTRDSTRDIARDTHVTDGVSHASPDPTRPDPKKTSSSEARRRARIPLEWKPTDADITWQRNQGISDLVARRELPKFVDHHTAKGQPLADWSAAWRNWLRRAGEFGPTRPPQPAHSAGWEFGMD